MDYLKIPNIHADFPIERFAHHRPIRFIQASERDLPYVYRLREEVIQPYYDREGVDWSADSQRQWMEENVDPSHSYLIERTRPVGVIGLYPMNPTTLWLRHFYIEPNCQGMGLGSEVMESVTSMADVMGLDIELFKVPRNGPKPFYERHGFIAIEERDRELWMRRTHP